MMKLILRVFAVITVLCLVGLLSLPLVDARRAVPVGDRRAGLVSLNYFANLRFILGRAGMSEANPILGWLRDLQTPAYVTVQGYTDITGALAYADYLYYILPADGQEKLDIRRGENREVMQKGKAILATYADQKPERVFITSHQFEQVARTMKVLSLFGEENEQKVVENAWKAGRNAQPEGDFALSAVYYWTLTTDAAKVILKLAAEQPMCQHPFTQVYQEIRAGFRANSQHIAQLLIREGKLKAESASGVRNRWADQADQFIGSDCAFERGALPAVD